MLRLGQQARLLNQLLICTEGNVFHTKTVCTSFVSPSAVRPKSEWADVTAKVVRRYRRSPTAVPMDEERCF
jgi:hypothetical protein